MLILCWPVKPLRPHGWLWPLPLYYCVDGCSIKKWFGPLLVFLLDRSIILAVNCDNNGFWSCACDSFSVGGSGTRLRSWILFRWIFGITWWRISRIGARSVSISTLRTITVSALWAVSVSDPRFVTISASGFVSAARSRRISAILARGCGTPPVWWSGLC